MKKSNFNRFGLIIMSIVTAFYSDIKCLNWGLVKGGFFGEGIMGMLYIISIILIILLSVLFNKKIVSGIVSYSSFLSLVLLIYYLLTIIFENQPQINLNYFLTFTIAALLIPQIVVVNAKIFIFAMMVLPSFTILRIKLIFQSYVDWMNVISMDASYGYLIPIIANIVYVWEYYKFETNRKKRVIIIFSVINFIIFIQLLLFGSRGPLLAIVLLQVFLWLCHVKIKGIAINIKRLKYLLLALMCIIIFFFPLMSLINKSLESKGVNIYAIEKIISLQQNGDVSNGRNELIPVALNGFAESPIWGNGIALFGEKANTGLDYPHNFLLQILFDGGIILFCLIIIPVLKRTYVLLRTCNKDQFAVFSTLFFAAVPGALLSQDLWTISILWLFIGFILSKKFVY